MTSEIGFVEADLETVVRTWLMSPPPALAELGIEPIRRDVEGDLPSLLKLLPPLTAAGTTKHLFVPTAGRWTAIFDNGWRGPDVSSMVSVLAGSLRRRGLRVVAVPNMIRERVVPQRGRYGAVMLEIYGPDIEVTFALPPSPRAGEMIAVGGKLTRSVSAMNNGGRWWFHVEGEPLPFEQLHRYRAARVRDRFTPSMLRDYLAALGILAFDADFYAPTATAVLIELQGAERYTSRQYTLEEARAHY